MRNLVGLFTWIVLPVAVVVVAYKCATEFVEEAVINTKRRK